MNSEKNRLALSSQEIGDKFVPNLQCLSCGVNIPLDGYTYWNYQGPVICPQCKNTEQVVIGGGLLTAASKVPNIFDTIGDIIGFQVPGTIFLDLIEAASTFGVNANKACVVMCRRALQGILLSKGVADDRLDRMLQAAKGTPALPKDLYESAAAVRVFGNSGAHPQDPELVSIDRVRALLALEVVKDIIKRIYPRTPLPASR